MATKNKTRLGYKRIKGQKKRFVFTNVDGRSRQYRYRGGKLSIYEKVAKIPKTKAYKVDYRKNKIYKTEKQLIKKGYSIIKNAEGAKERLKRISALEKKIKKAKNINEIVKGRIKYLREFGYRDIITPEARERVLKDIFKKMPKRDFEVLKANISKFSTSFDYVITTYGYVITDEGKQDTRILTCKAVGKSLEDINNKITTIKTLLPTDEEHYFQSQTWKELLNMIESTGLRIDANSTRDMSNLTFKVTDTKIQIRFSKQQTL